VATFDIGRIGAGGRAPVARSRRALDSTLRSTTQTSAGFCSKPGRRGARRARTYLATPSTGFVDATGCIEHDSKADRAIKMTLPGPFTMTQLPKDEYYGDPRALAMTSRISRPTPTRPAGARR
jgi:hypothetical protein